jgi:hypothetical protein
MNPLSTDSFDSSFPPHDPPESTINESQRHLEGSAVKPGDRHVLVTRSLSPAHEWMAVHGLTRRHAIVIHTGYGVFSDWDAVLVHPYNVILFNGWHEGNFAAKHAEFLNRMLAKQGATTEDCRTA